MQEIFVRPTTALLALSLIATAPTAIYAASADHWVGTWATAPVSQANQSGAFATDTTLRQIAHVSLGGSTVRVVFTNEFGTEALTLGSATVALSANHTTPAIQPATSHPLTFSGHPGIVIPAGAVAVSDPVTLTLPALADLAVTAFLPGQKISTLTLHGSDSANGSAYSSEFDAPGNQLAAETLATPHTSYSWRFLKAVEVQSKGASIVCYGDSITDGAHSTLNANARWPDVLASRLQADRSTRDLGVLNTGIGGNRILHDGTGPNALARFDSDVLAQAGVRYVVLMEGINDIGHAADGRPKAQYDVVTADDLIAGLTQLARRAHTHGIKVIGATLTPYKGAGYASPQGEAMRAAVNQWIRTSPELDGVIDFDAATRDPANPTAFLPANDCGDHLHPGDAGYKAMGDAVDLKLFK
jgi:lysophospholipase L1-like esterase